MLVAPTPVESLRPNLSNEDRRLLGLLGRSTSAIIEVYDTARSEQLSHGAAMQEVFTAFGTAAGNQGLYRRVVAAYNRARKRHKETASC